MTLRAVVPRQHKTGTGLFIARRKPFHITQRNLVEKPELKAHIQTQIGRSARIFQHIFHTRRKIKARKMLLPVLQKAHAEQIALRHVGDGQRGALRIRGAGTGNGRFGDNAARVQAAGNSTQQHKTERRLHSVCPIVLGLQGN